MSIIYLREPTAQDLELLMAWRSNPFVYETDVEGTKQPMQWRELLEWVASFYDRERGFSWFQMAVFVDPQGPEYFWRGRTVGYIFVKDWDSDLPEIGGAMGEVSLWKSGIAGVALEEAFKIWKSRGLKKIKAVTLDGNGRIAGFLPKHGFGEISSDGKIRTYVKELV